MTLYRRYRLLQLLLFVQCFCTVGFGVYVLVSSKTQRQYTVSVNQSAPVDLSFLDMITNRVYSSDLPIESVNNAHADPSNPHTGKMTPVFDFPLVFDGYFVRDGVPHAVLRGFYFKCGDYLHGRMVNSISPAAVEIEGNFYPIRAISSPSLSERSNSNDKSRLHTEDRLSDSDG